MGDDACLGGDGDDTIDLFAEKTSEIHDNLAHGGKGHDVIVAAAGNDVLFGNEGDDYIEGNGGNDQITPGPGVDDARGGEGDDEFIVHSLCEISNGDFIDGGNGFDTVRSPFSEKELEAAGLKHTSIEAFELAIPARLGQGACYEDFHEKIRCECCEPGWGGDRCQSCIDSTVCGMPAAPVGGTPPTNTRYHTSAIPEFAGGVYPQSVQARDMVDILLAGPPSSGGSGWYFGMPDPQPTGSISTALTRGKYVPVGHDRVWTLGIRSLGAQQVSLSLEGLVLPPGAQLWAYSEHAMHGPVSAEQIGSGGGGFVPPLPGDTVYLEILEPGGTSIGLDTIGALGDPQSGGGAPDACFESVACVPGAEGPSRGVGIVYRTGGSAPTAWCSGSLLSTNGTEGAVFLTAEHCLAEGSSTYLPYLADSPLAGGPETFDGWESDPGSLFVQFRYRDTDCGTSSQDVWSDSLTYGVEEYLFHDHRTDVALLKLAQQPDPTCVGHLGYDARASSSTPPYSVGIRHPAARRAQVDADMDTPSTTEFFDGDPLIQANVRYPDQTKAFFQRSLGQSNDIGWLEGGASGGALFDNHGRVIGCLSGHSGETGGCSNGVDFFDGRLAVAYETSVDEQTSLQSIINPISRDLPASTFSDPFPLSPNSDSLAPCTGQTAHFVINPLVADATHVEWFLDYAPGQVVGTGTGELFDYPQHEYYRSISLGAAVNPGGAEPPITIRIETHFGPGHPECGRTSREFVVHPVECI